MRKLFVISVFCLGLLSPFLVPISEQVEACGGFFCQNIPVDQRSERIIFSANGDSTITAVVGIGYTGPAEEFSWVVPVPSIPEVDVADQLVLNNMQYYTRPRYRDPINQCRGLIQPCCGGGGGVDAITGEVGPYDYAVVSSDDSAELISWLRTNDYDVPEDSESIIAEYVADEMYFLALKLNKDSSVGDIQPIVMTYESTDPMIPIKLTRIASIDNMPIHVWIFGDAPYVPQNYEMVSVDASDFQQQFLVADNFGRPNLSVFEYPTQAENLHARQRSQLIDDHDGLAFSMELTLPHDEFFGSEEIRMPNVYAPSVDTFSNNIVGEFIDNTTHITYLYGEMSPDEMVLDPVFVPDPAQELVGRITDITHLDSLLYWGCSTEFSRAQSVDMEPLTARTRLLRDITVAHPDSWQSSHFFRDGSYTNSDGETFDYRTKLNIFSPAGIDEAAVEAFFEGDTKPPMLIHLRLDTSDHRYWNGYWEEGIVSETLAEVLNLPIESTDKLPDNIEFRTRYSLYHSEYWALADNFDIFLILAGEEDWQSNGDLYNDMLDYVAGRQYLLGDDFEHTLFLTGNPSGTFLIDTLIQIPYPSQWTAFEDENKVPTIHLIDNEDVTIKAIGYDEYLPPVDDSDSSPFLIPSAWRDIEDAEDLRGLFEAINEVYGFNWDQSTIEAHMINYKAYLDVDGQQSPYAIGTYENDGRTGVISLVHGYIIQQSAPSEIFADVEATFSAIRGTMTTEYGSELTGSNNRG